jgi:hypothetical protein
MREVRLTTIADERAAHLSTHLALAETQGEAFARMMRDALRREVSKPDSLIGGAVRDAVERREPIRLPFCPPSIEELERDIRDGLVTINAEP